MKLYPLLCIMLLGCDDTRNVDMCFPGSPRDNSGVRRIQLHGLAIPGSDGGIIVRSESCKSYRFKVKFSNKYDAHNILNLAKSFLYKDLIGMAFVANADVNISEDSNGRYVMEIIRVYEVKGLSEADSKKYITDHSIG